MTLYTADGKQAPAKLPEGPKLGFGRAIFSADGNYIRLSIPQGRPKDTPPREKWTNTDYEKRFGGISGQFGTYSVSGDKVTFRIISAMPPSNEGREAVCILTNQGDDMVLTNRASDGSKSELRLRRAK